MKLKFSFLIFSLLFLANAFSQTQLGAFIIPPNPRMALDFKCEVAEAMHITLQRDAVNIYDEPVVRLFSKDYQVALNMNSVRPGINGPQRFPTDTIAYKVFLDVSLSGVLLEGRPSLVVIENEEANRKYFSGYARDYINELRAAIPIIHAARLPVTNAGITAVGLSYLVYKDLLSRGLNGDAQSYVTKTGLLPNSQNTKERAAFVDTLLSAYQKLDLDFVNFHWYQKSKDTWALGQTMNYLIKRTGKRIISNEFGQYDSDPLTVTYAVNEFRTHNSPLLIWYSGDGGTAKAVALQNNDRSLRATGIAYRDAQGW